MHVKASEERCARYYQVMMSVSHNASLPTTTLLTAGNSSIHGKSLKPMCCNQLQGNSFPWRKQQRHTTFRPCMDCSFGASAITSMFLARFLFRILSITTLNSTTSSTFGGLLPGFMWRCRLNLSFFIGCEFSSSFASSSDGEMYRSPLLSLRKMPRRTTGSSSSGFMVPASNFLTFFAWSLPSSF